MITFVCWKWQQSAYRSKFGPETVNVLARMIRRHYQAPHRVLCVTNDAAGIDSNVEIVPDREDFKDVPSPHGGNNPACFRRLRMFAPDAAETFGERIVSMDLDCVITSDLTPLFDRPEDFVAWRDPMHSRQINGSLMLLRAGSRPQVWDDFNPDWSPGQALRAGYKGSDQGWISYCLRDAATWTGRPDGVYSYRVDQLRLGLPSNARVAIFHGALNPWDAEAMRLDWVREHYR